MAMKDDFHLVLFDQPDTETARHRMPVWSRILTAGILVVTAATIAFTLVVGNPLVLFANPTAFLAALSASQDGTHQETPMLQSSAGAPALPPMASAAPTNNEIVASSKAADQSQTEIAQAPTQVLLGQFQAWAAGKDAQAEVPPSQPVQEAKADPVTTDPVQADPVDASPAQEARTSSEVKTSEVKTSEVKTSEVKTSEVKTSAAQADPVDDARAEIRPLHHHRLVRRAKTARAETEIRTKPSHRAKIPREQDARVYYRPAQAREPDPPAQAVQAARPPTFLESIGLGGSREY
jgi:DNA-directed RNA polymerase subunit M/transcription elongation factor TFIIS